MRPTKATDIEAIERMTDFLARKASVDDIAQFYSQMFENEPIIVVNGFGEQSCVFRRGIKVGKEQHT